MTRTSCNDSASGGDDRRPGRQPVAHEDRLPRPGAGRRAARLHAHGPQRRSPGRDRRRRVTDTLPSGVTFDSATPSQGSCSQASGTVTCALGTIADQGTATVQILVRPSAAGTHLQPGQRVLSARRPEHRQQLGHRPDAPSPRRRSGYPRPAGASPLRASLVPAYNECTAPNRTHGPPLDSALVQPTRAALGLPDGRHPRRQRQKRLDGRVPAPGDRHRQPRHAGRRGRRQRSPSRPPTCA